MNMQMDLNEKQPKLQSSTNWARSLDFLWLEITSKCNLNCIHCYAESSPFNLLKGTMSFEDWVTVIHDGFDAGCRRIQFIGGEPTLHPNLLELIVIARNTGYKFIEVFTNGTTLTYKLLSLLAENDVNLAVSVYSFNSVTHDNITLTPGSHAKTIEGIKKALALGLKVRACVIQMDENSAEINETSSFLNHIGIKNVSVDRKRGIGRGAIVGRDDNTTSQLCGNCWKGRLAIDANGNVFPCVFSKFHRVGQINEGLEKILSKSELGDFRILIHHLAKKEINMTCSPFDEDACQPDDQKSCPPYTGCNPDYCSPNQSFCNPDNCTPGI